MLPKTLKLPNRKLNASANQSVYRKLVGGVSIVSVYIYFNTALDNIPYRVTAENLVTPALPVS